MASIDTFPSLVPRSQKPSKTGVFYKFLRRAILVRDSRVEGEVEHLLRVRAWVGHGSSRKKTKRKVTKRAAPAEAVGVQ